MGFCDFVSGGVLGFVGCKFSKCWGGNVRGSCRIWLFDFEIL